MLKHAVKNYRIFSKIGKSVPCVLENFIIYSESTVFPLGRAVIENLRGEHVKTTTNIVLTSF